MRCFRTVPMIQRIDELKESQKVDAMDAKLSGIMKTAFKQCQGVFNKYFALEVTRLEEKQDKIFQEDVTAILRLLVVEESAKRITNDLVQNLTKHEDTLTDPGVSDVKTTAGFAYLLLLTGDACRVLVEWCNEKSPEGMFVRLTTKLTHPSVVEVVGEQDKQTINIGGLDFCKPDQEMWSIANTVCKSLERPLSELTLGIKTKFYNKIALRDARTAAQTFNIELDTLNTSEKVFNILQNDGYTIEEHINNAVKRKSIVKKIVSILERNKSNLLGTSKSNKEKAEVDNVLAKKTKAKLKPKKSILKKKKTDKKVKIKIPKDNKEDTNSRCKRSKSRSTSPPPIQSNDEEDGKDKKDKKRKERIHHKTKTKTGSRSRSRSCSPPPLMIQEEGNGVGADTSHRLATDVDTQILLDI